MNKILYRFNNYFKDFHYNFYIFVDIARLYVYIPKTISVKKIFATSHYSGATVDWMDKNIKYIAKRLNPLNDPQVRPIENF